MRLVKKLEENSVLIFSLFFLIRGLIYWGKPLRGTTGLHYLLGKTTTKYKWASLFIGENHYEVQNKKRGNDDFVFNGR
jgi:hypothetical protein